MPQLEFRLLGPVEASLDGEAVPLGGPKQRALLAMLLLNANAVVSQDDLMDALWGDEPPATAAKSVQVHVSRLRRALEGGGGAMLRTRAPGYVLELDPRQVDVTRFEHAVADGRRAVELGEHERAAELLRRALAEWHGPALADLASEPFARDAAARLDEQRVAAHESSIDAELALGRHAELVGRIGELSRAHPYRERLCAQLMLALYRSGRQAEALDAYRRTRAALVDDLGVEPGPELRELERRVLEQDPSLDWVASPPPAPEAPAEGPTSPRRRQVRIAVGLAAIAAIAGAVAIAGDDSGAEPPPIYGNTLVRVDPERDRATDVIDVGIGPDRLAVSADAIWVANSGDNTVSRIDRETLAQRRLRGFPYVGSIATDPLGAVYVSTFTRGVYRIDPKRLLVSPFVSIRGNAEALAAGAGRLWVTNPSERRAEGANTVSELDPETDRVARRVEVGLTPIFATYGFGRVWVSNYDSDTVSVLEPGSDRAQTIAVGAGPLGIATGEGSVWVVAYKDRRLVRLDPESHEVEARIAIGNGPLDVAVGDGAVWVTNREDGTLLRIDPSTNEVVATIDLELAPHGVIATEDDVWVTIQSAPYG